MTSWHPLGSLHRRSERPPGPGKRVGVHDFADPTVGKAVPYGVYDLGRNTGWVSVGTDHDSTAFAVATLRRWWEQMGVAVYPKGRCCVPPARGMLKPRPSRDQIAKANSSNATATRRLTGSSTANS
jgi:hypothetical protein